jgi:hypothetical protein
VRVPLDRLLLKPNIPAGASVYVLASLVLLYRHTTDDAPPAEVRDLGNGSGASSTDATGSSRP